MRYNIYVPYIDICKGEVRLKVTVQYSFLQCLYWMAFGAMFNFSGVYLYSENFKDPMVGIILSSANIVAVVMQPFFAALLDRAGKSYLRYIAAVLAAIAAALSAAMVFFDFAKGVAFVFTMALLLTIQPLINSLGMRAVNNRTGLNYGIARGVGSAAYAAFALVLGMLTDMYGAEILPISYSLLFAATAVMVILFRQGDVAEQKNTEIKKISVFKFAKKYKKFMIFIIGESLIFFCSNMVNNYMIRVVQNVGGNSASLGILFAIDGFIEIPVMVAFSLLIKKIGIRKLLRAAAVLFTVKAAAMYMASSVEALYAAQIFHMLSYAVFIPGAVYYVDEVMEDSDKVKGQALITSAMTIGSIFGSFIGGWVLSLTGVSCMLLMGTIVSAVGSVVMFASIQKNG